MKIKIPNIEFSCFKDGLCDIYTEDEEGNKSYKFRGLGFEKRVLGFGRHYAAKAVQVRTDSVIRVPKLPGIDSHDTLKITNLGKYDIEFIQDILDSNPLSLDLTLRQLEMFEVKTNE